MFWKETDQIGNLNNKGTYRMFISSTTVIFLYIRFRLVVYNCDDNSRDILVHVVPHNLVVFCCYGIMNAMFKLECGMFIYRIVC